MDLLSFAVNTWEGSSDAVWKVIMESKPWVTFSHTRNQSSKACMESILGKKQWKPVDIYVYGLKFTGHTMMFWWSFVTFILGHM